jgi:hypothetical protein
MLFREALERLPVPAVCLPERVLIGRTTISKSSSGESLNCKLDIDQLKKGA